MSQSFVLSNPYFRVEMSPRCLIVHGSFEIEDKLSSRELRFHWSWYWVGLWVDGGLKFRNHIELFRNHLISLELMEVGILVVELVFSMDEGVQIVEFAPDSIHFCLKLGKREKMLKFNNLN